MLTRPLVVVVVVLLLHLHRTMVAHGGLVSSPSYYHKIVLVVPFATTSSVAYGVILWPCSLMPWPWHHYFLFLNHQHSDPIEGAS